jgi:tRNA-intron endonuclease, archaea type
MESNEHFVTVEQEDEELFLDEPIKVISTSTTTQTNRRDPIKGILYDTRVFTEPTNEARELFQTGQYGKLDDKGRLELSLLEALYLVEKERLTLRSEANRAVSHTRLMRTAKKNGPNFWTRYCVYRDFRNRGYIIKTALKFGADFRVYDRGIKPGQDHAKWIVYPVREGDTLTWHDFASKNRVAHSTKKRLLIAIVDDENDVTYYEVNWTRP